VNRVVALHLLKTLTEKPVKFFIDTANLDQIREAAALGVLDGVTTNPSLLVRETKPYRQILEEICAIVDGPVSAEVTATEFAGMVSEGKMLAQIHPNICVKLPTTKDGLKACVALRKEDIPVNMTLVFSPLQALLCAKANATFVSPFVGRLDDIATDGMDLIQQIVTIFGNYGFETGVLVASVRHPIHVVQSAMMGADVVTMPFDVIEKLIKHPLTDLGVARFLADWKKGGQQL
jgi:transaldolase